ncbi:hypothetical protein [Streptosporangium saharense]|uniref:hypothetical protein n=1 Tax=Streptosporangium saharense TaxID=1706840 RepID=UPI0036C6AF56
MKVISEILGHATAAFAGDIYTSVAEELQEQAAVTMAAFVPRKKRTAPICAHRRRAMISETTKGIRDPSQFPGHSGGSGI